MIATNKKIWTAKCSFWVRNRISGYLLSVCSSTSTTHLHSGQTCVSSVISILQCRHLLIMVSSILLFCVSYDGERTFDHHIPYIVYRIRWRNQLFFILSATTISFHVPFVSLKKPQYLLDYCLDDILQPVYDILS